MTYLTLIVIVKTLATVIDLYLLLMQRLQLAFPNLRRNLAYQRQLTRSIAK